MRKYPRRRRYYRRNNFGRYYPKPNTKNPPRPLTKEEMETSMKMFHLFNDPPPKRAWEPWLDGPYVPGYAPRHRFIPRGSW